MLFEQIFCLYHLMKLHLVMLKKQQKFYSKTTNLLDADLHLIKKQNYFLNAVSTILSQGEQNQGWYLISESKLRAGVISKVKIFKSN